MKKILLLLLLLTFIFHPKSVLAIERPVNLNFESSRLGPYGFNFWDGTTGGSTYALATASGEKHGGRNSVKVVVGPNPGQYGAVTSLEQVIKTTDYAGKTVRLSAWCKTNNGAKVYLKISITHANGIRDTYWRPSVTPLTECPAWKQLETPWVKIPDDVISLEIEGMAVGTNGTVWFDDYNLETETPLPAVIPDQRFGFGGNPQMAKDLNIPWYYNWTINPPTLGRKSFLTIGKVGNSCSTNSNLATFESQGLKDEEDRAWYGRLDQILKKFEGKPLTNGKAGTDYGGGDVCVSMDSMRVDFLKVATDYAVNYPGIYYQVANEPDWYPYFTPEDYADYYNIFYSRIKKYDPSAHINPGGLLSISKIIWSGAAWGDKYRDYKWIEDFRNIYKTKFGSFPPISAWSVHPYSGANWEDAKQFIIDFHDYLVSRGETAPMWLTEFGPLMTEGDFIGHHCAQHGCLSEEEQDQEWNEVANNYMKPLINWLKSTTYVQKWFWFYAGRQDWWNPDPNVKNLVGDVYMTPNGDYNPIGLMYKQLAEEGAEKIPNCSITSGPAIVTLGETPNYSVSFSSAQGNLGGKISIGQNGNFQEDINDPITYQSSTAATGTFTWTPKSAGTFDLFCRAWNDSIAECRGNTAYVDGLPRYECAGPKAYMTVKVVSPIPGDLNKDRVVNIYDYNIFVSQYNQTGNKSADLNKSGKVDNSDYTIIKQSFVK